MKSGKYSSIILICLILNIRSNKMEVNQRTVMYFYWTKLHNELFNKTTRQTHTQHFLKIRLEKQCISQKESVSRALNL